jgi:hypothetical protein
MSIQLLEENDGKILVVQVSGKVGSDTDHPLLVLALERTDHASQGHVHDRIRHSPHTVLVVTGGTSARYK